MGRKRIFGDVPEHVAHAAKAVRKAVKNGLSPAEYRERYRLADTTARTRLKEAADWTLAERHGVGPLTRYFPPGTPCPERLLPPAERVARVVDAAGPAGIDAPSVARRLGLHLTRAAHHLRAAHAAGRVCRRGRGGGRRYFPVGSAPEPLAVRLHGLAKGAGADGVSAYDLARSGRLDECENTIAGRLRELHADGLLTRIPSPYGPGWRYVHPKHGGEANA
ncbi:hypothetical protein [Alienimonas sp. DA493]|uniref:hypothetical protein n=1 Tax=Alienimonas sp. DA493 TaxID=3373605 RepID=UPI00375457FB